MVWGTRVKPSGPGGALTSNIDPKLPLEVEPSFVGAIETGTREADEEFMTRLAMGDGRAPTPGGPLNGEAIDDETEDV